MINNTAFYKQYVDVIVSNSIFNLSRNDSHFQQAKGNMEYMQNDSNY